MTYFKNRAEAGQQLAEKLEDYQEKLNTIILALPRGGVPIAYEIANHLHLPMTVFLVRKLGTPAYEELAMGAIAESDIVIFNENIIHQLGITKKQIQPIIEKQKEELLRRQERYRQRNPLPSLTGKTIILVDDGIATGVTMKAAIAALIELKPHMIIVAVPVASQESIEELASLTHKVVYLHHLDPFESVGQCYHYFPQVLDEEVVHLLNKTNSKRSINLFFLDKSQG